MAQMRKTPKTLAARGQISRPTKLAKSTFPPLKYDLPSEVSAKASQERRFSASESLSVPSAFSLAVWGLTLSSVGLMV